MKRNKNKCFFDYFNDGLWDDSNLNLFINNFSLEIKSKKHWNQKAIKLAINLWWKQHWSPLGIERDFERHSTFMQIPISHKYNVYFSLFLYSVIVSMMHLHFSHSLMCMRALLLNKFMHMHQCEIDTAFDNN